VPCLARARKRLKPAAHSPWNSTDKLGKEDVQGYTMRRGSTRQTRQKGDRTFKVSANDQGE
jgi:hypothetical protein